MDFVYLFCKPKLIVRTIFIHYLTLICSITLSDGAYQVIKSPTTDSKMGMGPRLYLGKSKKGVYCALTYNDNREDQLQVWLLTGKMEWTLKIDISLHAVVAKFCWPNYGGHDEKRGPWNLHTGWYDEGAKETPVEDNSEWDFDNGIILETQDKVEYVQGGSIYFLGFHPYKEIVFLWVSRARVVAYDFRTSSLKVQDLGRLRVHSLGDSFPYTPCWTGELFEKN